MKKLIAPETLNPEIATEGLALWDALQRGESPSARTYGTHGARKVAETDKGKPIYEFIGVTEGIKRDRSTIRINGIDLKGLKRNPVFLWAHSYSAPPIGRIVKTEKVKIDDVRALAFQVAPLDLGVETEHTRFADMIWDMYAQGYMRTVSFGWNVLEADPIFDDQERWTGGFDFKRTDALELSAVPVPADPEAVLSKIRKYKVNEETALDQFNVKTRNGIYVIQEANDDLGETREVEESEILDALVSVVIDEVVRSDPDQKAPEVTPEVTPEEVIVRAGAVINKRNLDDLKSAHELLGRVISSAEKDEADGEGRAVPEPHTPEPAKPEVREAPPAVTEGEEDVSDEDLDSMLEFLGDIEENRSLDEMLALVAG